MRFEVGLAIALGPLILYAAQKYTAWWDKKNGYGAEYKRVIDPERPEPQQPPAPHLDEQAPPQ